MGAWGQEHGDGSARRSVRTGVLGWEYCDGIMGIGVWGQERKNESSQDGSI